MSSSTAPRAKFDASLRRKPIQKLIDLLCSDNEVVQSRDAVNVGEMIWHLHWCLAHHPTIEIDDPVSTLLATGWLAEEGISAEDMAKYKALHKFLLATVEDTVDQASGSEDTEEDSDSEDSETSESSETSLESETSLDRDSSVESNDPGEMSESSSELSTTFERSTRVRHRAGNTANSVNNNNRVRVVLPASSDKGHIPLIALGIVTLVSSICCLVTAVYIDRCWPSREDKCRA